MIGSFRVRKSELMSHRCDQRDLAVAEGSDPLNLSDFDYL